MPPRSSSVPEPLKIVFEPSGRGQVPAADAMVSFAAVQAPESPKKLELPPRMSF